MFTSSFTFKWALGLLCMVALIVVATVLGSPPSAAAPAAPQYAGSGTTGSPLITPTPTVEPEYDILDYVKTNSPTWTCDGPFGTPGHRYLTDCNPFGYFSHPTNGIIDRYNTPAQAQAAWQYRRDNLCPGYPICLDSIIGGYQAYEAGDTAYPYAHYQAYTAGSVWLIGAVSSDDTHFRGAPPVANAIIYAANTLGYLPPGTYTPVPNATRTPTPTPTVWPTATSGAIHDLTGTAVWSSVCPDTVLRATTHFQASASVIANNSIMRIENSAGDTRHIPVPPLPSNTSYSYDCVIGVCVSSDWVTSLPITLTVDVIGQVIETNEDNNEYVLLYPPPVPTPCSITPTNTPTPQTPTPSPTCPAGWLQVPSPNASTADNYLLDVSAISPNDVWAVGYYSNTVTQRYETLTQHWNGSTWTIVPSPNPAGWHNYLRAVDGVASNDVWAVGDGRPNVGYGGGYLLTFHWDGTSWTAVPNPNPGFNYANSLEDVIAFAGNDVWAAGFWREYSPQGLLMHWNGSIWTREANPVMPAWMYGISGTSNSDMWAVGYEIGGSTTSLVWRRIGTSWSIVPSPDVGALYGVSAVAANDAWAVGEGGIIRWNGTSWNTVTAPDVGVLRSVDALTANDAWAVGDNGILHWNGAQWTVSPSPALGTLEGIEALAADVWAVGSRLEGGVRRTLVERYIQGGCQTATPMSSVTRTPTATATCPPNWQQIPSPNASTAANYLLDVSAIAPDDVWAVGYYSNTVTQRNETLIQHWDGSAWTIVPSPNPAGWHNYLRAVDGVAANDVWAVGDGRPNVGYGGGYLLTLHWDGTVWTAVPNPNPGYNYANWLGGVVALASNDVWATGMWRAYSFRGLLMHWDGFAWVQEIDPLFGGSLPDISGVASNDMWAVGQELGAGSLIYHRDDTGWSRISSPDVGGLGGVSALASNDVWAVGENGIIRWNGTSWVTMTVPVGGLLKVDARTPNDVWVVASTAVLHWNGSQWTIRATAVGESLTGVDAVAANDVWAAGSRVEGGVRRTLIQRYSQGNCQTTTPTPVVTATPTATVTPSVEPEYAILQRVKDNHPTWNCVGPLGTPGHRRLESCLPTGVGHVASGYVDRYNTPTEAQAAWQNRRDTICPTYPLCVDSPYRGYQGYEAGNYNYPYAHHQHYLWGNVWLMGSTSQDDTQFWSSPYLARAIIDAAIELGYLGQGSPTITPTATTTPSITPTVCMLEFTDVPPTNTFYPFVRCLACKGIINGYPCGGPGEPCDADNNPYFRPNNYVTRGQVAKIVSESAGFEDEVPPSQWTFADVPYGSTFWVWVERLAAREVMSGYPCGGPSEPCDSENRPYFRPNTGATRAQLAKIVVNAAGFVNGPPPGFCTFADTCGTIFNVYIERLVWNRPGSINGYPCGSVPNEPCDSENRPYFRPNNPLTRGQTSKVTANVFFPGCNPP
jgi:hypothetical protein